MKLYPFDKDTHGRAVWRFYTPLSMESLLDNQEMHLRFIAEVIDEEEDYNVWLAFHSGQKLYRLGKEILKRQRKALKGDS